METKKAQTKRHEDANRRTATENENQKERKQQKSSQSPPDELKKQTNQNTINQKQNIKTKKQTRIRRLNKTTTKYKEAKKTSVGGSCASQALSLCYGGWWVRLLPSAILLWGGTAE